MKVELWLVGKTAFPYLDEGIHIYQKRLKHYLQFKIEIIPDIKNAKNLSQKLIKQKEGEKILKNINSNDLLLLLDENGKMYDSIQFSQYLEKSFQLSHKRIIFLVGGAYGFSKEVYDRANQKISLSKMTFSHQMIRLFFVEQLYRAMTIQKNEPYHHS